MRPTVMSQEAFTADLAAAKSGDRAALGRLLERLGSWLEGLVDQNMGRSMGKHTRASDIVQEVCVEVVRRIDGFRGQDEPSFRAWVRTIATSTTRAEARRLTRARRRHPSNIASLNDLAAQQQSSPTPSSALSRVEHLNQVLAAIASLREDQREVIEQHLLQDRPIEELAEQQGRTVSATRMVLFRARAALALAMERLERQRTDP